MTIGGTPAMLVNPLGRYSAVVAAIMAITVLIATVITHLIPALIPSAWLDNASLIIIGIVFGVQASNGPAQETAVHAASAAYVANGRLDALGAPRVAGPMSNPADGPFTPGGPNG